jgi:hypothetical protein
MSAVRNEMSAVRNEMSAVRNEMSAVRNEMSAVRNEMSTVRNEIISWQYSYSSSFEIFTKLVKATRVTYVDEAWVKYGRTILLNWRKNATTTPKNAFLTVLGQD